MRNAIAIIAVWFWTSVLCTNVLSAESSASKPDQRITIDALIDQRPARLLFDTGASLTALFASSTNRLGLVSETNRMAKIAGHDVPMGSTRSVELSLLGKTGNAKLPILPFPAPGEFDGVLSWLTLGDNSFLIDTDARRIRSITHLPDANWQRWALDMESMQLFFTVTDSGKPLGRVFVDTGAPIGLRISPRLWEAWKKQNPKAGVTLNTYRYAVGETMVHELAWTAEYQLGDLLIRDVDIGPTPEAKGGQAIDGGGKEFIATIGMRGLQHLRMIVNRSNKEVLTQVVSPLPTHNRVGAVFKLSGNGPFYSAQVLENSPAHKAGLRTGDVLISINDTDFSQVTRLTLDPEQFFTQPAGTKLILKVKRGEIPHEFRIVLADLIP